MRQLILEEHGTIYSQENRRPDARLYERGELVRFISGEDGILRRTVLRVAGVKREKNVVQLQRRSGHVFDWTPSRRVEVFTPSSDLVRRGSVFEWRVEHRESGARRGELARVVEVDPAKGVTVRSHRLGDVSFGLSPGTWHHAVLEDGIVAHLRNATEYRLDPYRDVDPAPSGPTHSASLYQLAKPFALTTHGSPPPLSVIDRGDLVYVTATDQDIPENHVFRVRSVDHRDGRTTLVDGMELSSSPIGTADVTWTPHRADEVRIYKPARSIAAQDLVVWRRDETGLLVRKGSYAEILAVQSNGVVLSGVTSRPEVLSFDRERWSARWSRNNDAWQLSAAAAHRLERNVEGPALALSY